MRVRWLVILLRLTEMERVATRIVRASPNGKIPHVKLAEKKKKHILSGVSVMRFRSDNFGNPIFQKGLQN